MKFEIVSRQFKEKTIENLIIKMFEYFSTIESDRAERLTKYKDKQGILTLLKELADYIENGLRKKFSENVVVLITQDPNYAIKFEKGYLLGLKYDKFEIIIFKSPFICIPTKFHKILKQEEKEKVDLFYSQWEKEMKDKMIVTLNYYNKYYNVISLTKEIEKLKEYDENFFKEIIIRNVGYLNLYTGKERNLNKLACGIQYDIFMLDREYK